LIQYFKTLAASKAIVFLEKNSILSEMYPDIYIFLKTDVSDPRPDMEKLEESADFVVNDSRLSSEVLNQIKKRISNLRAV